MQKIIIDKPYKFIPPHRGRWLPTLIQRLRLYDIQLRKVEGVTGYEVRGAEKLKASIAAGHGILMTPNHARTSDPLVMGFLARETGELFYAMASWHLFHQDWLSAFSIPKMGGFSVNREAADIQSVNLAVRLIETAERPLFIFPEGSTTRTNDRLHSFLEGVSSIARTAARRRRKLDPPGKVVVHPVAIKYRFLGDLAKTVEPSLAALEGRYAWHPRGHAPLVERIDRLGRAWLGLREIEHLGETQPGTLDERRWRLIEHLLSPLEAEWLGQPQPSQRIVPRVKNLRTKIVPDMIGDKLPAAEKDRRWRQLAAIYLSQQLSCYLPDYLAERPSVDRILESVERLQEDMTDVVSPHPPRKAVICVGDAMEVSPDRDRTAGGDVLMDRIARELQAMLDQLALESPLWEEPAAAGP